MLNADHFSLCILIIFDFTSNEEKEYDMSIPAWTSIWAVEA
jgi:hypothetical protein